MKLITIVLFSAASMLAQNTAVQPIPSVPQELLGKAVSRASRPHASAAAAVSPATVIGESYELVVTSDSPLTVQPGQFTPLPQSNLDFTGATHASIAVTSLGTDLTGLRIIAAWAAPGTWFNMTDVSPGSSPVIDHTGLYAPAYGPGFKVVLYNQTAAPMVIKQISVYATK